MGWIENETESSSKSTGNSVDPSEFDDSLRYMRWLLRSIGIWPRVALKPMKIEYVLSNVVILPFVAMSMISLTTPIYCYVILQPLDRLETIVLIAPIIFETGNILMHFIMFARSRSIKICVEHMELDWRRIEAPEERDIMKDYVRFSHRLTVACIFFMYTGAFGYSLIIPLLAGNTVNEMNETIRPRPFPGTEMFFDVQANVVYEIVFFINFIAALFHYTVTTTVCNLAIVLVSHACAQIQIVMANLDSFVDRVDESRDDLKLVEKRTGFIVRRHVRIIKFVMHIENALNEMILLEVVASTLILCFLEYEILLRVETNNASTFGIATYITLFFSFAFNLFVYCQFGEVLKGECLMEIETLTLGTLHQCEKIGEKAYLIDWLRLPGRTKLTLIMIINMCNNPCKLTAGRLMELSIFNFASVLKSSFAYLNMMRATG